MSWTKRVDKIDKQKSQTKHYRNIYSHLEHLSCLENVHRMLLTVSVYNGANGKPIRLANQWAPKVYCLRYVASVARNANFGVPLSWRLEVRKKLAPSSTTRMLPNFVFLRMRKSLNDVTSGKFLTSATMLICTKTIASLYSNIQYRLWFFDADGLNLTVTFYFCFFPFVSE